MRQCRYSSSHCKVLKMWFHHVHAFDESGDIRVAITWLLRYGAPHWKANEWLLAAETMMMMTMIIITAVSRYDDLAAAVPMIHERLLAPGSLIHSLFLSYYLILSPFTLFSLFLSLSPLHHHQYEITNSRSSRTVAELRLSLSWSIIYET